MAVLDIEGTGEVKPSDDNGASSLGQSLGSGTGFGAGYGFQW